jgi:hypothetical protein
VHPLGPPPTTTTRRRTTSDGAGLEEEDEEYPVVKAKPTLTAVIIKIHKIITIFIIFSTLESTFIHKNEIRYA